mmetsp:Transcript_2507/g.6844  ORF Transcript_2507/g.6844 Transcript_2507/m.6844 type:complete len:342 (-) Transcript_2507:239-1264(-)
MSRYRERHQPPVPPCSLGDPPDMDEGGAPAAPVERRGEAAADWRGEAAADRQGEQAGWCGRRWAWLLVPPRRNVASLCWDDSLLGAFRAAVESGSACWWCHSRPSPRARARAGREGVPQLERARRLRRGRPPQRPRQRAGACVRRGGAGSGRVVLWARQQRPAAGRAQQAPPGAAGADGGEGQLEDQGGATCGRQGQPGTEAARDGGAVQAGQRPQGCARGADGVLLAHAGRRSCRVRLPRPRPPLARQARHHLARQARRGAARPGPGPGRRQLGRGARASGAHGPRLERGAGPGRVPPRRGPGAVATGTVGSLPAACAHARRPARRPGHHCARRRAAARG